MTGLFDDRFDEAVPPGFDFDYVGADGLSVLTVEDRALRSVGRPVSGAVPRRLEPADDA